MTNPATTKGTVMRVNARFEGVAEQQVEYLMTSLGASVSEVLRLSVENYYATVRSEKTRKLQFLGKHIGKAHSGRSDLSVNYKAELTDILNAKYGKKQVTEA
jgi:hypothetical protein